MELGQLTTRPVLPAVPIPSACLGESPSTLEVILPLSQLLCRFMQPVGSWRLEDSLFWLAGVGLDQI